MRYPRPKFYKDWKAWAEEMLKVLSTPALVLPLRPPQYDSNVKPVAKEAGLIIYFANLEYCAISHDNAWYKLHDPTTLVP
jgi:hypothetical protein|tara:strand:+ start:411 stop:650 length:240 start_codon:yes stop_codon:yes gene_type:complete